MHIPLAGPELVSESADKLCQLLHFIRSGHAVNTENRRDFHIDQMPCNSLIGEQHEVLDQVCRVGPLPLDDLDRPSHFVQDDLGLREVEVDAAPLFSLCAKSRSQLLHPAQHSRDRLRPRLDPLVSLPAERLRDLAVIPVIKQAHDAVVGKARVHMDDRLRDLVFDHFSLVADRHQTAHSQAVFSCVEGTDPVGKLSGKHRDHAVSQIDTGPAVQGFLVQRGSFCDILRHIGDMNAQDPVIALSDQRNGVIDVLGVLSVNGDGGNSAQVFAVLPADLLIAYIDMIRKLLRLLHDLLRKFRRNIIGPYQREDIDAGIGDMTEDLVDFTHGVFSVRVVDRDIGDDLMAFQRAGFLVRLDLHDKGDLLVVRRHKSGQVHCDGLSAITGRSSVFYIILFLHGSSVGMKSSDDPCKSPLNDPDHFRFRSSAVSVIASALIKTSPDDLDLYGVAVNSSACASLRNEQVSLKSFYSDKAESSGIAVEFTRKM